MRLGLIGRVDNRGIGYQTGEFWEHMGHPRTLIVTMDDGWPCDEGRFGYDDVLFVESNLSPRLDDRYLDEATCRDFLRGLDVVFAVETTYEWEFCNWAREMGVRVVVQGNPEMYAHDRPIPGNPVRHTRDYPHPDQWVWPTTWLLDQLPSKVVLPVPCSQRDNVAADAFTNELRIVHPAGKQAAGDRNGTWEFIEALRSVEELVHVTIITQDRRLPNELRHRRNVEVDVVFNGIDDRWDMYRDRHVMFLPRKYGGLCLPALEAMACGLCVVMSDQSPNETWPGPRVRSRQGRNVYTPAGRVSTRECNPMDIAKMIDALARNRDGLHDQMVDAKAWADSMTWEQLTPMYEKALEGRHGS